MRRRAAQLKPHLSACPSLRSQFFRFVFAFVAEQLQRALGFFVGGRDLLLHLCQNPAQAKEAWTGHPR